jgi:tRNA threonylcarbamoyladenosine biosynthesis protein TsaE
MSRTIKNNTIVSDSPEETLAIAKNLARSLKPGDILYLYGELGSGKTVFVKGLCAGLGVKDEVTSPSFVIATEYDGTQSVAHVDLYRLDRGQVGDLPIEEYILDRGITVIEWADRIGATTKGVVVRINIVNHQKRVIEIEDLRD